MDIDRLMEATKANIVNDIKKYPERIGVIANSLDVRILHLPVLATLAITRAFADERLAILMDKAGLISSGKKTDALDRLDKSEVATAFSGEKRGLLSTLKKIGSNTQEAYDKVAKIAETNDQLLNATIAHALREASYIKEFKTEYELNSEDSRYSDIYTTSALGLGDIRLEVMWRKKATRADIANYVLIKLHAYGKALKLLQI